jgi:hypothetical protein
VVAGAFDGANGAGFSDANAGNSNHSGASAGWFKINVAEGERLFATYFLERGIPLDKAALVSELLTPRQTAVLNGFRVWSVRFYYWDPKSGTRIEDFVRLRHLQVRPKDSSPNGLPDFRFWQTPGSGSRLYQPVLLFQASKASKTWLEAQDDSGTRLTVAEGEVPAMRLALEGMFSVGLGGLWNHADRSHSQPLLKEFQEFKLKGREVEVNFDNDIDGNDSSLAALFHFSKALSNAGAEVSSWQPPPGKVKGPGDYVTAFGVRAYKDVPRLSFALAELVRPYNDKYAVLANPLGVIHEVRAGFSLCQASRLRDSTERTKVAVRQRSGKLLDRLLFDVWLEWGGRRSYVEIDYIPGAPKRLPNDDYNAWQDSGCPSIAGDVGPFLDLMKHLVPNDEFRHYVLQILAYPVAHPGAKLNLAGA